MNAGIPLGIFMGLLSGTAFVLCLLATRQGRILQAGSAILGIPATVFGGGWLTTLFDVEDIVSSYVTALAATAVAVGIVPLVALVVLTTQELLVRHPD